jgi:hypothetical protein
MPRGGRRFGRDAPTFEPTRPPRPPKSLSDVEREAWLELAGQVTKARTYNSTRLTAFRLAVKGLAAVYAAPPDLKATTMRGLLECASKLIGRFGLDAVTVLQADAAPAPQQPDELDEFADVD